MNKFAWIAVLLLALLAPSFAADFGISVNSPYLVTEWRCGQVLKIQWNKWGNWAVPNQDPANLKVQILLSKVASTVGRRITPLLIADNVPATSVTGTYNWRIPTTTANGEYHVIVRTSNKLTAGKSEVFIIKGCPEKLLLP